MTRDRALAKSKITDGHTAPARKRRRPHTAATVHDVAKHAGVSIKTVSRVVNHEPNVRASKSARVLQAIAELNYHPNFSARNLVRPHASLIALIYGNVENNNYLVGLQEGALLVCEQFRYSFLLQPAQYDNPRLVDDLLTLVRQRRPSGLVITPPLSDVPRLLDALDGNDVAYALISSVDTSRNVPIVSIDERRASYDLTKYLISLGHKRIGFVAGHPDHAAARLRYDGYATALRDSGIPISEELIAQGMFSFDSGIECGRALLSLPRRPSAIYAANDDSAAGVLHVAHDLSIRIPEQLSIAGFDDAPISRYVWPTLTTVRQPVRAMAEAAVRQLIMNSQRGKEAARSQAPRRIAMAHEIVVRHSTAVAGLESS
jgi:LacI family transcriptional regulator